MNPTVWKRKHDKALCSAFITEEQIYTIPEEVISNSMCGWTIHGEITSTRNTQMVITSKKMGLGLVVWQRYAFWKAIRQSTWWPQKIALQAGVCSPWNVLANAPKYLLSAWRMFTSTNREVQNQMAKRKKYRAIMTYKRHTWTVSKPYMSHLSSSRAKQT